MKKRLNYSTLKDFGRKEDGFPYFEIAMAGLPSSGKTNYSTIAIHKLAKPSHDGKNMLMGLEGDTVFYHHQPGRNFEQAVQDIFVDEMKPRATQYSAEDIKAGENLRKVEMVHYDQTYRFSINDTMGEAFRNLKNTGNPLFVRESDGFMITVNPLDITGVRQKLEKTLGTEGIRNHGGATTDGEFIETSLSALLKAKKDDAPVAIIFTKFDLILGNPEFDQNLVGPNSNIAKSNANIIEKGNISLEKIEESSDEVRDLLVSVSEDGIVNLTKSLYRRGKCRFFAVSGYGDRLQTPAPGKQLPKVSPHRVLDPILWHLKLQKFL
ncbi:MAG: hypothetical protein FWG63_04650 [Defluviitaleaceae bacterium]|nr:hypothetical protein [Defluviitaleaceae bacterium]